MSHSSGALAGSEARRTRALLVSLRGVIVAAAWGDCAARGLENDDEQDSDGGALSGLLRER
jgi:hypothetical protein